MFTFVKSADLKLIGGKAVAAPLRVLHPVDRGADRRLSQETIQGMRAQVSHPLKMNCGSVGAAEAART